MELTQQTLKELLHYDPETGVFTWRKRVNARAAAGDVAGLKRDCYRVEISIGGRRYFAHRLAWLYVYGEWPPTEIDHINRNDRDNRISNLRLANRSLNNFNRGAVREGLAPGVSWFKPTARWRARIKVGRKEIALGYFHIYDDAVAARKAAEERYYAGFPRHDAA